MDLGFHIADFTWNGGPPELAPTLGRLAREAEAGGIARLTVMDHFWQIGPVGAPDESMLEAYTTLLAGCANCQLHLESKAAFPVPQRLQEKVASLASSRPETITASVHTRGGLHGGVPLPIDAHARGANTPFKVELVHD
jgi:alkanesulfonate monooxygenase SsuD/methylene tetrahydromethanopterin reductase-like flavin-dependent oxidoreductase (luciferase family)